jgi:hypothetical protein
VKQLRVKQFRVKQFRVKQFRVKQFQVKDSLITGSECRLKVYRQPRRATGIGIGIDSSILIEFKGLGFRI